MTLAAIDQLCCLLFFMLSWGNFAHSAEPRPLNIGWTGGSAWTALPDRVAMERGFFEKEGLKPRYIQFQGTNLMLNALLSNELDYVTIMPFIAGAATRELP
jgi:ABC-type nitrate/sulfonate/bicarbonate transport system substrate-binding protein